MRKYCKAYLLQDFRRFSAWKEQAKEDEAALADDAVCYLWDDFVVVQSPILEQGVLFEHVTPEWQDFCRTTLGFELPEDLRQADQEATQAETVSNASV